MFAKTDSKSINTPLRIMKIGPSIAGYAHAEIFNQTNDIALRKPHDVISENGKEISVYVVSGFLEFAFMYEYFKFCFKKIGPKIDYSRLKIVFEGTADDSENKLDARPLVEQGDGTLRKTPLIMSTDKGLECPVGSAKRIGVRRGCQRCYCFDNKRHVNLSAEAHSCVFEFKRGADELISKNRMFFVENGIAVNKGRKNDFYNRTIDAANGKPRVDIYNNYPDMDRYCEIFLNTIERRVSEKDTLYLYRVLDALSIEHFCKAKGYSNIMSVYVLFSELAKLGTLLEKKNFCEYQQRVEYFIRQYTKATGRDSAFLARVKKFLAEKKNMLERNGWAFYTNGTNKIKKLEPSKFFNELIDRCYYNDLEIEPFSTPAS